MTIIPQWRGRLSEYNIHFWSIPLSQSCSTWASFLFPFYDTFIVLFNFTFLKMVSLFLGGWNMTQIFLRELHSPISRKKCLNYSWRLWAGLSVLCKDKIIFYIDFSLVFYLYFDLHITLCCVLALKEMSVNLPFPFFPTVFFLQWRDR